MGYVHTEIKLKNPLKLENKSQCEVTTADGRKRMVAYVGPIEVFFENRNCGELDGDILMMQVQTIGEEKW